MVTTDIGTQKRTIVKYICIFDVNQKYSFVIVFTFYIIIIYFYCFHASHLFHFLTK